MMREIPVDLDRIGTTLGVERKWYLSVTPPKLQHLFSELYEAKGIEGIGYFKIKAVELLYHMDQLTQNNGCDFKYFDKGQIQTTKEIRDYLISHLEERASLEELTQTAKIKKYKMNIAAHRLLDKDAKIGEIAMELGYSNASKFAKAFQSVYGELPKDYRKKCFQ